MLSTLNSVNSDMTEETYCTTKYNELEDAVNSLCSTVTAIEGVNDAQAKCIMANITDIANIKSCLNCSHLSKSTIDVNNISACTIDACTTNVSSLTSDIIDANLIKTTATESNTINACNIDSTTVDAANVMADKVDADTVDVNTANIDNATIENLKVTSFAPISVDTTCLTATSTTIDTVKANTIAVNNLTTETAIIDDLTAETTTITDATIAEKDYNSSTITLQKYLTVQSTTDLEIVADSFTIIKNGKVFNIKNALSHVRAIYDNSDTLTIEFTQSGYSAKIRYIGNEPITSETYSTSSKNIFDLVAANSNDITVVADYSFLACINDKIKGNTWDSICVDTICSYRNDTVCFQCPVEQDGFLLKDGTISIDDEYKCAYLSNNCICLLDKQCNNITHVSSNSITLCCNNTHENCIDAEHICIKSTTDNCPYVFLSENEICFNQNNIDALKLTKEGEITGVTCISGCSNGRTLSMTPSSAVFTCCDSYLRLQRDLVCLNDGNGRYQHLDEYGYMYTTCDDNFLSYGHYKNGLCLYEMDRNTGNHCDVNITVDSASLPATNISGDLCVIGGIYQCGGSYTTHAEDLNVNCCLITTRSNATSAMAATEYSGLKICMGLTSTDDLYIAAKNDGQLYVGKLTSLQPVATRTNLTNGCFVKYDATNKTLVNADDPKPDYSSLTKGCIICYDGSNLANASISINYVTCAKCLTDGTNSWTAAMLNNYIKNGCLGCIACARSAAWACCAASSTNACRACCSCYIQDICCTWTPTTLYTWLTDGAHGCVCCSSKSVYATCSGTSCCSLRDGSGNIISSCYAKKASNCCSSAVSMYGYLCNCNLYLFTC